MIGERLEEGRKRKGVTIREASEATKIRGDYLMAMEDNSFDISLPQVYLRGFLKNYARYLKLDPQKILTDYDAYQLGRTSPPAGRTRASRESFGHMELHKKEEAPSGESAKTPEEERIVVTEGPPEDNDEPEMRFDLRGNNENAPEQRPSSGFGQGSTRHEVDAFSDNKSLYLKIGLAFAGLVLVAVILVTLVRLLGSSSETPEINPELATGEQSTETSAPASTETTGEPVPQNLVISASDNVTLIVEQTMDRDRLYSGSLTEGEQLSLEKVGPVSIRFTNGQALSIEVEGRNFNIRQSGVGRTVIE